MPSPWLEKLTAEAGYEQFVVQNNIVRIFNWLAMWRLRMRTISYNLWLYCFHFCAE